MDECSLVTPFACNNLASGAARLPIAISRHTIKVMEPGVPSSSQSLDHFGHLKAWSLDSKVECI